MGLSLRRAWLLALQRRGRSRQCLGSRRSRPCRWSDVDGRRGIRLSKFPGRYRRADLDREREGLANDRAYEHDELAAICVQRVDTSLARQVAAQLMQHDALGAHARDELGIRTLRCPTYPGGSASAGTLRLGLQCLPVVKGCMAVDYPRARPR
jgi:hypothetical protein